MAASLDGCAAESFQLTGVRRVRAGAGPGDQVVIYIVDVSLKIGGFQKSSPTHF